LVLDTATVNWVQALMLVASPVVFSTLTAGRDRRHVARDARSGRSDAKGKVEAA
jgi:hypothetical protein